MSEVLMIYRECPVNRVVLNRPERRNALSRELIGALHVTFTGIAGDGETRVVVLAGAGTSFCGGGDIGEYAVAASGGTAVQDAEMLADCLAAIANCPVPVVARVQGNAF